MKAGVIVYRCRRCDGLDTQRVTNDVAGALGMLLNMEGGQRAVHACPDGGAGVTDLIGAKPDPEAPPETP